MTATLDLHDLMQQQQEDERWSYVARDRPLEILAGLNPHGMKASRPRYFLSGRIVKRRRRSEEVSHGSTAMYKRGCRCGECRREQSERNKAWRAERKLAA